MRHTFTNQCLFFVLLSLVEYSHVASAATGSDEKENLPPAEPILAERAPSKFQIHVLEELPAFSKLNRRASTPSNVGSINNNNNRQNEKAYNLEELLDTPNAPANSISGKMHNIRTKILAHQQRKQASASGMKASEIVTKTRRETTDNSKATRSMHTRAIEPDPPANVQNPVSDATDPTGVALVMFKADSAVLRQMLDTLTHIANTGWEANGHYEWRPDDDANATSP
eukprot:2824297-Rhodomonas_salina.4